MYTGDPEKVKKDLRVSLEELQKILKRVDKPAKERLKKIGVSAGFEEIEVVPIAEFEAQPPVDLVFSFSAAMLSRKLQDKIGVKLKDNTPTAIDPAGPKTALTYLMV